MLEDLVREIVREEILALAPAPAPEHEWYTTDEAAAYLKISTGQVHNLVSAGALPRHGEKGHRLRFLRDDLDDYVEGRWRR